MNDNQPCNSAKGLHAGHRKRMKDSLLSRNTDFADHQLLEMLLFYSIPRRDTNETAHRLINECGSLKDVLFAPPERLLSVDGVGRDTVAQIAVLREIYKSIRKNKHYVREQFDALTKVGEFVLSYFDGDKKERVAAMLLNSNMVLINTVELSCGSVNSAPFDSRELARTALVHNATRVILVHNHPAGELSPSTADRLATQNAESALDAVGVTLVEHIIVGEFGYTPMMQLRLGFYLKGDKNDPKAKFYKHFYAN